MKIFSVYNIIYLFLFVSVPLTLFFLQTKHKDSIMKNELLKEFYSGLQGINDKELFEQLGKIQLTFSNIAELPAKIKTFEDAYQYKNYVDKKNELILLILTVVKKTRAKNITWKDLDKRIAMNDKLFKGI